MNLNFLKEFFAHFARSRGIAHHFKRLAMFESMATAEVSREVPKQLSQELLAASNSDVDALLLRLESHPDGLSEAHAALMRERFGHNEVEHEKPPTWWQHLWNCYKTPFDILLTLLAAISYLTEDMKATIVISTMVVLSVAIRFWQERKSNHAAEKLKAMVTNTATVLRRDLAEDAMEDAKRYFEIQLHPRAAQKAEIPIRDIVPGDIVFLSAGDMIPADCRILTSKDLFVSQAAMTGESLPVEKHARTRGRTA